jgi:hypothetical protein
MLAVATNACLGRGHHKDLAMQAAASCIAEGCSQSCSASCHRFMKLIRSGALLKQLVHALLCMSITLVTCVSHL